MYFIHFKYLTRMYLPTSMCAKRCKYWVRALFRWTSYLCQRNNPFFWVCHLMLCLKTLWHLVAPFCMSCVFKFSTFSRFSNRDPALLGGKTEIHALFSNYSFHVKNYSGYTACRYVVLGLADITQLRRGAFSCLFLEFLGISKFWYFRIFR